MKFLKELWSNKKFMIGLRILLYFVGLLLVLAGGVKLMTMVMIGVFCFLVGMYLEKIKQTVKDWRVAQRVQKVAFTAAEHEELKKKCEDQKAIIEKLTLRVQHNVPTRSSIERGYMSRVPSDFYEDEEGVY